MKKYLTVFQLSFQNEFTYRLNFILWRFRNILRILMTYFLWNSVFSQNKIAFGYTHEQMIAYVFLVLVVNTLVIAAPSNDNIGGEISNGDLSNYLLKPMNYLGYWLTRDWASKLLNILFAIGEIGILFIIFRPSLNFTNSAPILLLGIVACIMASLIYYQITKLAVMVSFWAPENTWGLMFLFLVLFEILSGTLFPLSILPQIGLNLLRFTPFPYMVYFPIGILIDKFNMTEIIQILLFSSLWLILGYFLVNKMFRAGLKEYSANGR
ncbi:ABC-2 family transporter protein [Candidatus Amesbacteria bacterium]|nr:ABC-2 family transporter protein [Candidatus Amesbacteria bacterium]